MCGPIDDGYSNGIDENEILVYMLRGWELRNFGEGWLLSEPHIPYKRSKSHHVLDSEVKALEDAGKIKTTLLTRSFRADLVTVR